MCFAVCPSKGLCLNSVAQEKAFKVMDVLDAQARKFAVLFLRCCEHGAMKRTSNLTLCRWWSRHHFRFQRKLSRSPLARALYISFSRFAGVLFWAPGVLAFFGFSRYTLGGLRSLAPSEALSWTRGGVGVCGRFFQSFLFFAFCGVCGYAFYWARVGA